jgi:hypothetical protein
MRLSSFGYARTALFYAILSTNHIGPQTKRHPKTSLFAWQCLSALLRFCLARLYERLFCQSWINDLPGLQSRGGFALPVIALFYLWRLSHRFFLALRVVSA